MKLLLTSFLFLVFSIGLSAQIDSKKKSGTIIPAIEAPKDSTESKKIAPEKLEKNNQFDGVTKPNVIGKLELPKKEFSMFPQEEFGNPGELYTKKLEKIEKTLLPEGHGENAGLKEDAYWGDYNTTSKSVRILYRDYSAIDGDLLRVYVNGDVIQPRVYLTQGFSGFKLDLKNGLNEIVFQAINTGSSGPNTAEYRIVDDNNKSISSKVWALATGVKVTVIVNKL
ncbi:hypothetical protein [Jejuia pallidilutea]|uniref:Secreted protein n=2 Tax=Jejuia pallidilutea TaxID=504487 RepID=A0A098LUX5_9FLAO|nr:hypothetical protein [Jejuia pallidilutea]PQV47773.1 hypothetical protein CLV33_10692 [Jejuia pallidilutea]GAL90706.1 hypothetical protein JCM19538_471 [Jejuia pallidilutea]